MLSEGVPPLTGTGARFERASGSGRSLKCYDVTGSRAVVCHELFCFATTLEPISIVLFLGALHEDLFMKGCLLRVVWERSFYTSACSKLFYSFEWLEIVAW